MTEETGAAAPTTEQAASSAPAASEQAQPAQSVQESAAPEQAQTEQPDSQADTQAQEEQPKKPSRYDRMKRRMTAMSTELENLRAQLGANNQSDRPKPPQESDFNGDYFAFQSAKTAFDAKQAVREEFEAERTQREQRRMAELQAEMVQEFEERAADYRQRIPDFDSTIESFVAKGGRFSQTLVEELQSSDVGPALAYQIAKNPVKAAELSAMSPREVAREIGRLEAAMSVPKPKTVTKAPPPMSQPSGGAAKPQDLHSLAKSTDASAYINARRQAAGAKS